ncbi:MAG: beta-galactosidase, partial [Spirochaetaceae bacterium]|nr:beta-galactosidase [Spirochaetaceae bacterium]
MPDGLTFGVDYYPEQWDESSWERDADRMRELGFTSARLMEFAWSIVEPEKGKFDFALFDKAIGILAKRGIKTILGTPTAAIPAWLADGGAVLRESPDGKACEFGTRRNACFNSPAYREAARRVVTACADRYGRDERVMGWQVDNEIGHEGSDLCACPRFREAWHRCLERRYGLVDALNKEWGTVFWSSTLSRFDQAPLPRAPAATKLSPGLLLDYYRFSSDSAVAFAEEQVAIIRERTRPECFVTTNLFSPPFSNAVDMARLAKSMDFASWDNYPVWGTDQEPLPYVATAMALSFARGLSREPFTVMEQFSGIQGHGALGYLPPERQAALWTNQAIARGANRIVYFSWRTAPFGQ